MGSSSSRTCSIRRPTSLRSSDEWSEVLSRVAADLIAEGALGSSYDELPFDQRLIADLGGERAEASPRPSTSACRRRTSPPTRRCISATPCSGSSPTHEAARRGRGAARPGDRVEPGAARADEAAGSGASRREQARTTSPVGSPGTRISASWRRRRTRRRSSPAGSQSPTRRSRTAVSRSSPAATVGDLIDHCPTGHDLGIPDRLLTLSDATPLPLRAGSALIFGQQLVHGSLDNTTGDQVRISIDLRYQPPGQPSGRPDFPSFLVRSADAHGHDEVLDDPAEWRQLWADAQRRLSQQETPRFNRWNADSPSCA